jgi:hypothetical protein
MTLSAIARVIPLAALALAGCTFEIKTTSPVADPLREVATRVTPGTATRDTVRQMLGSPLWTSARWRAELYSGEAVLQVWNYGLLVPIPTSKKREPATLLVVFGPDDVVLGTAYSGPGCGSCGPAGRWGAWKIGSEPCPGSRQACVDGDLQGLEIEDYRILLAPEAANRDLLAEPAPSGRCALLVAQSDRLLAGFDLYLDDHLLQRIPRTPSAAFVRAEIDAGQHHLACTAEPGWFSFDPGPSVPAHDWPGGKPRRGQSLLIACPADGQAFYRLVNTGGKGAWRASACGIVPVDSADFATASSGARLVIVSDRPE